MKQSTFFFLIISLFTSFCVKAQTIDEVVGFANSKFDVGEYEIASTEYNRAYFLGYEQRDILLYKIAQCYFHTRQYDQAGKFFDRAYLASNNDSMKNEAVLAKTFCFIMNEEYKLSVAELLNLSENLCTEQQLQAHLLKGVAHYQLQEDLLSLNEFEDLLILAETPDSLVELLHTEFDQVFKYDKRYKPNRAYVLSAILPGLGQVSSGAYRDGINSFLLIGSLYAVALRVMYLYSFWDAALALLPWVQRYYLGGMEGAKEMAISKIESKRYESYIKIIELTNFSDEL